MRQEVREVHLMRVALVAGLIVEECLEDGKLDEGGQHVQEEGRLDPDRSENNPK